VYFSSALILFSRRDTDEVYRRQSLALVAASLAPGIGFLVSSLGRSPWHNLDITMLCFSISCLPAAWGLFRWKLLDLVPVAYHSVVESLSDGVLVLDREDRIVAMNPAAENLLSVNRTDTIGHPIDSVLCGPHNLLNRTQHGGETRAEVIMGNGMQERVYDLRVMPLLDRSNELSGRSVVVRDITERKRDEHEREDFIEQLQELATIDELTGLNNRRQFFMLAEHEWGRAKRYRTPLAAVMMDVDHFKKINDTHGHAAGDEVLRAIARCCLENLRELDVVGRYGGEEFAILLVDTGALEAREIADRIRACIADTPVQTMRGLLEVTVSMGVAETGHVSNLTALLDRADAALYVAKDSGRNYVAVA
jgi:diguanylate cyclase (GGDEF)-like protein/PAS domain S-box-containing protein